ncbi:hypothetical protein PVK06_044974 [Gossypium arboreum]|uniref:Uncharacterized protein n=1 Tax=Gossypium arboreum TaxID=29729 RepID=A0ABR0MSR3_GOSAR|nr:hypothetical protein PVK06_044974 [Gossypium arboreum]
MSSSTNKKSSAQKRILDYHCRLTAPVYNANIPKNKVRKFYGCVDFKRGNNDGIDSTIEEQGCTINEIMLQNNTLLTENKRLRLENDELNIDQMRRMQLKEQQK